MASKSVFFQDPSDPENGRYLCCCLLLLRPEKGYVVCLSVNGRDVGQFRCSGLRRAKRGVGGLERYYVFRFPSPLTPTTLGFRPGFSPVKSLSGSEGLTPGIMYDNCSLVTEAEASAISIRGEGEKRAVRLGGVGAWAVVQGEEFFICAFVLCFDLFAACCDRRCFPSLARLYAESVRCDDDRCAFCRDHGKHVDATGGFVGCVPDRGVCFCYTTCGVPEAAITNDEHVPFFVDTDDVASFRVEQPESLDSLSTDPSVYMSARDSRGGDVPLKTVSWQLMKMSPDLSRMIALACPVIKRLLVGLL